MNREDLTKTIMLTSKCNINLYGLYTNILNKSLEHPYFNVFSKIVSTDFYLKMTEELDKKTRWSDIGLMLAYRLRRWPNLYPTSGQRLVFVEKRVMSLDNNYDNPYSAGIDFKRQNRTSADVRFWRLKSIPALKE